MLLTIWSAVGRAYDPPCPRTERNGANLQRSCELGIGVESRDRQADPASPKIFYFDESLQYFHRPRSAQAWRVIETNLLAS